MTTQTPPTDVQATLSRLSAYKNVQGVLILSRTGGGIIQSSGSVFDGDKGKKYGKVVAGMVEGVGKAVGVLEEGVSCDALSPFFFF